MFFIESSQVVLTSAPIGGLRKKHGIDYPSMGHGLDEFKGNREAWAEFNNAQRYAKI
jgi:hypothetical protein